MFHIYQVAQMTILPKGKIAMIDDNESKMLSSDSKKNAYYFDYTIKADNQPKVGNKNQMDSYFANRKKSISTSI